MCRCALTRRAKEFVNMLVYELVSDGDEEEVSLAEKLFGVGKGTNVTSLNHPALLVAISRRRRWDKGKKGMLMNEVDEDEEVSDG